MAIQLFLASTVAFNIFRQKTTQDLMTALSKMYEGRSASNKIFLMKKLFNLKMTDSGSIVEHLNEFNMLTSQLESVVINLDDEIRALFLLSNLSETWDGLVMAVSNSYETGTLKFDDAVGVLLAKRHAESHRVQLRH